MGRVWVRVRFRVMVKQNTTYATLNTTRWSRFWSGSSVRGLVHGIFDLSLGLDIGLGLCVGILILVIFLVWVLDIIFWVSGLGFGLCLGLGHSVAYGLVLDVSLSPHVLSL